MSDHPLTTARWAGVCLALAVFWLNLSIMAPTITAGDSAELSAVQSTLGIAHSPGYPLFAIAGRFFSWIVPAGHAAYRTNVLSVFLSAVSAFLIFRILILWSGSTALAVAGTLLSLSTESVRKQFAATEVFALNSALFLGLFLALSHAVRVCPDRAMSARIFYLAGFLFGISMGNQHTIVLFAPSFAVALAWRCYGSFRNGDCSGAECLKLLLTVGLFFVLGLSIYFYLPVRSLREPMLDWEDPQTLKRFWAVVTRARYGTFQLAQGVSSEWSAGLFLERSRFFARELFRQTTVPGGWLIMAGSALALCRKSTRGLAVAVLLFAVLAGPFFLMLANVSVEGGAYEIVLRFLPLPMMGLTLLGVAGISTPKTGAWVSLVLAFLLFRIPPAHSERSQFQLRDFGKNVLRTLPENTLLFADRADECEFALAYLLYAENRRRDVRYVDCNAGVTRSVYGPDYYPVWGKPRLMIRETVEQKMTREWNGPVCYATVEPDMIAIPRFRQGIIFRAKPEGYTRMLWDEIYALRWQTDYMGFRGDQIISSHYQLLGEHLLEMGETDRSILCFRAVSLLDPDGGWYHVAALKYLEKGARGPAEQFFKYALSRDPHKDKVLCNYAVLCEQQGDPIRAESLYQKAVSINPLSYQAHYNLGVLYWKQSRWKDVAREFESVIRINPQHADARKYLESARRKM